MIDQHERIDLLLPWLVSEGLEAEEEERVRRHIANCVACRGQLRELEELSTVIREAPSPSFDADAHLLKIEHRLAEAKAAEGEQASSSRRRSKPLQWLLLGQVAALLLVATLIVLRGRPNATLDGAPQFRTLATSPSEVLAGSLRVRILFSEDITEQGIRELLHLAGGRIVDGPNAVGLFVLELDPNGDEGSSPASRLESLRASDGVRFAEWEGEAP